MSRKPRVHVAGGLFHVILRGNGRGDVFFDSDDRQRWESILEDELLRHDHRVHAYCWMTNHIHAAIQCGRKPLSQFMGSLAGRYSRSTNKKLGRSGHLFERRFTNILVKDDSYLMGLIRYIHQNPVDAGLVKDPADYRWCSHKAYLGGHRPNWLSVDWVLRVFGDTEIAAREAYLRFMQQTQNDVYLKYFRDGGSHDDRTLSDDGFADAVVQSQPNEAETMRIDTVIATVCEKYGITKEHLSSNSRERIYSRIRAEIGLIARESGIATISEVARIFGRSQAGLSRAICKLAKTTKTSY